ncbi:leukemia inhibitory factor receptor isoform X2 [Anoplopoma fimbria]|uniref:leukemia inhibitory factor receptor isoform X2 n=1 Tax=Anoplopoma fimbria TaxID=229290 RepID=UPI0023EDBAF9|nr:leukemia inhibitory factor receptor isoform X2 [Anoplopoma fimbria]
MNLRDFPLYLMETLKFWSSLHEYIVVFMFLIMVSKGSACEAPSSPECFKRNTTESVYICEWSMNTTESNVIFYIHFNKTKFKSLKKTYDLGEEFIRFRYRAHLIWVEARVGNSSCMSTRRSVILAHTVKYEAPQNISMSWFKNNLNLRWIAAETYPALAEIRFRLNERPTESWEKLQRTTTTTSNTSMYNVIVANLLKDSVYQVQIRQRSTQALNPLWSDWSPVVTVPAELEQKPEVTMMTWLLNGTRKVTLTWKPMPYAAAVMGVVYNLTDTQSSLGCPCKKKGHLINTSKHTTFVSLSAINITVIARNTAGYSPPAIIQVPAEPAADLKICDNTLLDKKLNKKTCLEWHELPDGDSRTENVITLTARMKKMDREKMRTNIKDYVRYLYFEHRCEGGWKPQTVKMCLFYQKEGVPLREPQELAFSATHTSVDLSWKAIPSVDQRGFLTHYILCSVKFSSQDNQKECSNISASLIKHHLENLTPGTKYNISLVGVTRVGAGPEATVIINTLPEKPVNESKARSSLLCRHLLFQISSLINQRVRSFWRERRRCTSLHCTTIQRPSLSLRTQVRPLSSGESGMTTVTRTWMTALIQGCRKESVMSVPAPQMRH